MVPARIGNYRLEDQIGMGGMGEVYRAWDEDLERPVAVKLIRQDREPNLKGQRRFRREALTVARLRHRAIVQIHQRLDWDGGDAIVMELIEGQTLGERLRQGSLDLGDARRILTDVAAGLAYAHGENVVHRDLKSDNVMVTPEGHAKILDFGLARSLRPETTGSLPGHVVGTLHCMSPEQASGLPVDHRSDLFSLGVLSYEALTGRTPFKGENAAETLARVCRYHPTPVRELRPEVDEALGELVQKLLEKDPERRPPNAAAVLEALSSTLSGATLSDATSGVPSTGPRVVAPQVDLAQLETMDSQGATEVLNDFGKDVHWLRWRWLRWRWMLAGVAVFLVLWLGVSWHYRQTLQRAEVFVAQELGNEAIAVLDHYDFLPASLHSPRFYRLHSWAHETGGDYEEQLRWADRAVQLAEEREDSEEIVLSLLARGNALRDLGRYDEALAVANDHRFRETSSFAGSRLLCASTWLVEGKLYNAKKCLEGVEAKSPQGNAEMSYQLGQILWHEGSMDLASEEFERSREWYDQAGNRSGVFNGLVALGAIEHSKGNLIQAMRHYENATEQAPADAIGVDLSFNLAEISYLRADFENAKGWLAGVESSLREADNPADRAYHLLRSADVDLAEDRTAIACQNYSEARELFRDQGDPVYETETVRGLIRCALLEGRDLGGLPEALDRMAETLRSGGVLDDAIRSEIVLGRLDLLAGKKEIVRQLLESQEAPDVFLARAEKQMLAALLKSQGGQVEAALRELSVLDQEAKDTGHLLVSFDVRFERARLLPDAESCTALHQLKEEALAKGYRLLHRQAYEEGLVRCSS